MYDQRFTRHLKYKRADNSQLVDLMHGDINLKSELGQGTTTTFCIPFNKSQSTKLASLLVDMRPMQQRLESDLSIPGCVSATQSVIGDFPQNPPLPGHLNSRTGTGLGQTPPKESLDEEPIQQEIDRKTVHVLVVEDKYVALPSFVYVFLSMKQVAKLAVAVPSISK